MHLITLETSIAASKKTCFDLSRDIDLHLLSARDTKEKVIAGRNSGLCELNDEVTWQAIHFGFPFKMKVRITRMEPYDFFQDEMVSGPFKSMRHEHHFREAGQDTIMTDFFYYEVPFGFLGKLFNTVILKWHLTRFLKKRNDIIRHQAEYTIQHEVFRDPTPEPINISLGFNYVSSIKFAYPFDPIIFDNYGITINEIQFNFVDMENLQFEIHQYFIHHSRIKSELDFSKYSEVHFQIQGKKHHFKFQFQSELEFLEFKKLICNLKTAQIPFRIMPYGLR